MAVRRLVLLFLLAALHVKFSQCQSVDSFGCRPSGDTEYKNCPGPYTPARPFNISVITNQTRGLTIGNDNSDSPLLHMPVLGVHPSLTQLTVYDFSDAHLAGSTLNISAYLPFVRQQISLLAIEYGNYSRIDQTSFAGMVNLATLRIEKSAVSLSIFLGTFASLNPGELTPFPKLAILSMNTALDLFDWTLLEPVRNTLQQLELKNSRLQKLLPCTDKTAVFPALTRVDVSFNQLSSLAENVLTPLVAVENFVLQNNPTCLEDGGCRCCELKPFMTWVALKDHRNASLKCGGGNLCTKDMGDVCDVCRRNYELQHFSASVYETCTDESTVFCSHASQLWNYLSRSLFYTVLFLACWWTSLKVV